MRLCQARRLKELEKENGKLKKLVADLTLDNAILKEATPCRPILEEETGLATASTDWA